MNKVGWLTWLGGVLLLLGVLSACLAPSSRAPTPVSPPRLLKVVGATDMAPFVEDLRARAASATPPVEIRYVPTNTATGLRLLDEGQADIALASWLDGAPPAGFTARPIGQDDLAILVHPHSGISSLTLDEVRRVFEGRYLSWAEVGGADIPVRLTSREDGSGARAAFEALVMNETRVALTAVVLPSGQDVVSYVARHEGAIGYASARLVDERVLVVRIDGRLPGDKAYPLRHTVYLVLPEKPEDWMASLIPQQWH